MRCHDTQGSTTKRHTEIALALAVLLRDYKAPRHAGKVMTEDGKCDLYITTHEGAYMLDVSVVHPLAGWALRRGRDSSKAMAVRARTKRRKYGVAAKERGATMV